VCVCVCMCACVCVCARVCVSDTCVGDCVNALLIELEGVGDCVKTVFIACTR
jgi:hypothetical protein